MSVLVESRTPSGELIYFEPTDKQLPLTENQVRQAVCAERRRRARLRLQQVRVQSNNQAARRTETASAERSKALDELADTLNQQFHDRVAEKCARLERAREAVAALMGQSHAAAQHLARCKTQVVGRVRQRAADEQAGDLARASAALAAVRAVRAAAREPLEARMLVRGRVLARERAKAAAWTREYELHPPPPPLDALLARPRQAAERRARAGTAGGLAFDGTHIHRHYAVVRCERSPADERLLETASGPLSVVHSAQRAATVAAAQAAERRERGDEAAVRRKGQADTRFTAAMHNLHMDQAGVRLLAHLDAARSRYRREQERQGAATFSRLDPRLNPTEADRLAAFRRQFVRG